jgi:hypothetical protein
MTKNNIEPNNIVIKKTNLFLINLKINILKINLVVPNKGIIFVYD